eukprot:TRINITY_DN68020_c1_g2_i12.p1 TRINITY_DN68020_c1_g2~~TRINITY_DN68020_c1_g2_i12.p1  ORF type:complete len:971 (-),score=92.03 TRINITY_DN68020_c1_g2_i12:924-3836(-)
MWRAVLLVTCSLCCCRAWDPRLWMGSLPDTAPLGQITIPGSHSSGASNGPFVSSYTQNVDILGQLMRGVRMLDLRFQVGKKADGTSDKCTNIWVVHAGADSDVRVDGSGGVLDIINVFLDENPSEFINLNVQKDSDCDDCGCTEDPLEVMAAAFTEHLGDKMVNYGRNLGTYLLSEVRGKVYVAVNGDQYWYYPDESMSGRFPADADCNGTRRLPPTCYTNIQVWRQNNLEGNVSSKYFKFTAALTGWRSADDDDVVLTNWLSSPNGCELNSDEECAEYLNAQLTDFDQQYYNYGPFKASGIIPMDFIDFHTVKHILSWNQFTKGSHLQVILDEYCRLAVASSDNSCSTVSYARLSGSGFGCFTSVSTTESDESCYGDDGETYTCAKGNTGDQYCTRDKELQAIVTDYSQNYGELQHVLDSYCRKIVSQDSPDLFSTAYQPLLFARISTVPGHGFRCYSTLADQETASCYNNLGETVNCHSGSREWDETEESIAVLDLIVDDFSAYGQLQKILDGYCQNVVVGEAADCRQVMFARKESSDFRCFNSLSTTTTDTHCYDDTGSQTSCHTGDAVGGRCTRTDALTTIVADWTASTDMQLLLDTWCRVVKSQESVDCQHVQWARTESDGTTSCFAALDHDAAEGSHCWSNDGSSNYNCHPGLKTESYCTATTLTNIIRSTCSNGAKFCYENLIAVGTSWVASSPDGYLQQALDSYCQETVALDNTDCSPVQFARLNDNGQWRCYSSLLSSTLPRCVQNDGATTNCYPGDDAGGAFCTRDAHLTAMVEDFTNTTDMQLLLDTWCRVVNSEDPDCQHVQWARSASDGTTWCFAVLDHEKPEAAHCWSNDGSSRYNCHPGKRTHSLCEVTTTMAEIRSSCANAASNCYSNLLTAGSGWSALKDTAVEVSSSGGLPTQQATTTRNGGAVLPPLSAFILTVGLVLSVSIVTVGVLWWKRQSAFGGSVRLARSPVEEEA